MEPAFDRDELLTVTQRAALLFVRAKTLFLWARSGRLVFSRTSGPRRRQLDHELAAEPDLTPEPPSSMFEFSTADLDIQEEVVTDADRAATAAAVVAIAAEQARTARQRAARKAAQAVAREAVRTARRVQIRAQSAVAQVADAADQAAVELAAATRPGNEHEAAQVATLLAAITEAAARATAQETERAAATVARDVEAAAAQIARMVAATDDAFAHRVSDAAEALESVGAAVSERVTDA